jgi:type II secretory pathway component GspD/PulD (secretin)
MQHPITLFLLCLVLAVLPYAITRAADTAAPAPASLPAPGVKDLKIDLTTKGWTIHAVSIDAHDLLTAFAAASKMQLIVDDTVKRQITIHIVDKSADEMLKTIVDAYGFSCAEVDGVEIVSEGMPRSPSSYLLSDIASVTTKYITPAEAWQLLPVFLQSEVKVNTDQNAVVLSGPKPVLDKFRQDVEQFDIPAEQIMLDVNVVEFTNMDTDNFAALLGEQNGKFGVSTDSLTGQLTFNALTTLPTQFSAQLQDLVQHEKAQVRANPRIATLSGQEANIFIGQQQYLATPVNLPGQGSSDSINAGVTLDVTPLTGGGGEIILDLNEEVSTLSAPDPVTGLPTKTTRSARTYVRVHDGQTVVIGGLRQKELSSVKTAIPLLSQLPLLGNFFKSKTTSNTVVDLAVFITARGLSQAGHLPGDEEQRIKSNVGIKEPVQP